MTKHFADRLSDAIRAKKTPLVVGLDPRIERLPQALTNSIDIEDPDARAKIYRRFCFEVIDLVAPHVPAVKPQAAFFEELGPAGMVALGNIVDRARARGLVVIMDAKRGDIGSTAEAYARAYLGTKATSVWACDSLTVNPYLGDDSLTPFVNRAKEQGSGIFVLVKTSNPGSQTLQELQLATGESTQGPVYSIVAQHVQDLAAKTVGECGYGSVCAVVGATYPEQLAELRRSMPNTLFLIPGFGAQGGTAADVAGGFDDNGLGAVVNSSRGIIFAYENPAYKKQPDWQSSIVQATLDTIQLLADGTNAGKLRS